VSGLADVRRFPASRRHPQFGREAFAAGLEAAGIAYRHFPDLGGHRQPRPDSPNTAWRVAAFRGYADHMTTPAFQAALAALLEDARLRPTAVCCAEAVPWRCHRQLIADAAVARGIPVRHILGPTHAEPHALRAEAGIQPDGMLVYPAGGQTEAEQQRLFRG
jgi:uncharacterized protein (DUF488 family)